MVKKLYDYSIRRERSDCDSREVTSLGVTGSLKNLVLGSTKNKNQLWKRHSTGDARAPKPQNCQENFTFKSEVDGLYYDKIVLCLKIVCTLVIDKVLEMYILCIFASSY
jgi:hypothetical protein